MLRLFRIVCLLAFLSGCVTAPPREERTVVLVSIDGFRADYLERGVTPALSALAREGAHGSLQPAFPTITFPNHYTLVTGVTPDRHGVIGNTMSDPEMPGALFKLSDRAQMADPRWWDGAEPIWVSAEKAGLRTATVFWPGSDVEIRETRPSQWLPYDKTLPPEARVDQALAWLDQPRRPRFMTLYFDLVDVKGHEHGPDAPETNGAIQSTDAMIQRLVDGLDARGLTRRVDLIVVSDHGMAAISPERIVWLDDHAPADAMRVETSGPVAQLFPIPGREFEVEAGLIGRRGPMECWRKEDVPERLSYGRHPRVPPIVCLAEVGWWIGKRRETDTSRVRGGGHGYDQSAPEMQALVIARGPSFRSGAAIEGAAAMDVHALLVNLLGLPTASGDGDLTPFRPALR